MFEDMESVEPEVRSRRRISEAATCPVCGCTLRPGELGGHLALEMDRLAKLSSGPPPKRRAEPPSADEVYETVRRNRERRLRAGRGRDERATCPVCDRRVPAADAEDHVRACLRRSERPSDDESVDVEGDGDNNDSNHNSFVSYEWCSQVRVRASALQLMDGGELPHGAMRIRRASTDTHLVVDGDDDDLIYGPPQYAQPDETPTDPDPTSADDPTETVPDQHATMSPMCYNIVLETLKSRVKELEQQIGNKNHRSEVKCLICIGPYNEPVVSVQCWHVYCEGCWLASLGAKKTCPQCNTITTTQHLRRIYL